MSASIIDFCVGCLQFGGGSRFCFAFGFLLLFIAFSAGAKNINSRVVAARMGLHAYLKLCKTKGLVAASSVLPLYVALESFEVSNDFPKLTYEKPSRALLEEVYEDFWFNKLLSAYASFCSQCRFPHPHQASYAEIFELSRTAFLDILQKNSRAILKLLNYARYVEADSVPTTRDLSFELSKKLEVFLGKGVDFRANSEIEDLLEEIRYLQRFFRYESLFGSCLSGFETCFEGELAVCRAVQGS